MRHDRLIDEIGQPMQAGGHDLILTASVGTDRPHGVQGCVCGRPAPEMAPAKE